MVGPALAPPVLRRARRTAVLQRDLIDLIYGQL
jgi:hypothetical protein